jgi:hypothetical protein
MEPTAWTIVSFREPFREFLCFLQRPSVINVKLPHSEEQGDPLDGLIRGRALSRKISSGHRHELSVDAPVLAATRTASDCDTEVAANDVALTPKTRRLRRRAPGGDVGHLLRGAYRQTVEEAIPDDLLDLLNRLE